MLIEFTNFQTHSADSKLSTNTYLHVCSCCISKVTVSIETKLRSSTLFTFGYSNLMLSLLPYISFYFNINIATFVGFQIAVYCMHTLRCVLLHTQAQVAGVNA